MRRSRNSQAASGSRLKSCQRHGVNEILAGAPDKHLVGPRRAKGQLRDDGVCVARLRAQNDFALRRGEAVVRQVGLGRHILHKFRDAQAGKRFDELLDVPGVRGIFFADDAPVVGALLAQNEIVPAAHLDFRDRRGQFQQPRVAEIVRRAAPWRQRLARRSRNDGVPALAFRINLRRRRWSGFCPRGRPPGRLVPRPSHKSRSAGCRPNAVRSALGSSVMNCVTGAPASRCSASVMRSVSARAGEGRIMRHKMVGRVAPEFDGNPLALLVSTIQSKSFCRAITSAVSRHSSAAAGNELEPAGVGHERAVHADDAQINLVAGRGPVAHAHLPALARRRR